MWLLVGGLMLVLLGMGLPLVILGLTGRAVDALPYCRTCGFCLDGLPYGVCPECGTRLAQRRATRVGRRRRRPVMISVGSFLTLLALMLAGTGGAVWSLGFNWNTIKPLWLLEREAGSPSPGISAGIWTELDRRLEIGILTGDDAARMARRALELQRDQLHSWTPEIGDFVASVYAAGHISEDDWTEYLAGGIEITATVRPEVRAGGGVPSTIVASGPRLGSSSSVVLRVHSSRLIDADGRLIATGQGSGAVGLSARGGGSLTSRLEGSFVEGRHAWTLVIEGALASDFASPGVLATLSREVPVVCTVVPSDWPTARLLEPDPLDARVLDAIEISHLFVTRVRDGMTSLSIGLRVADLPRSIAYAAYVVSPQPAEISGSAALAPPAEVPVGTLRVEAAMGQMTTGFFVSLPGFTADTLTLVLRPSLEVAERSTGLTEISPALIIMRDWPVVWPEGVRRPGAQEPRSAP